MLKVSWKKIILTLTIFIFLFLFSSSFKTLKADDTPTPTPGSASSSSGVPDCAKNNISKADCPRFIQEEIDKFSGRSVEVIEGFNDQRKQLYQSESFYKLVNYELIFRDKALLIDCS